MAQGQVNVWRDVDDERWKLGICIWRTGGEVRVGKRLYRVRWGIQG